MKVSLGFNDGRQSIRPLIVVSRYLECQGDIIDGSEQGDEGENIDKGVELDARQRRVFESASGILLVFVGLWEVFARHCGGWV